MFYETLDDLWRCDSRCGIQMITYADIQMITNNFNTLLGEGGFGKVYHGHVDGNSVAAKMISQSAVQGYQQFQSEVCSRNICQIFQFNRLKKFCYLKLQVEPLIRVHHRNLTTLVGYCNERPNLALIYEYMANGDLHSHISGLFTIKSTGFTYLAH